MPCNYNPYTGEVETLYERYLREYTTEEVLHQQAIEEKIDRIKQRIKEVNYEIEAGRFQEIRMDC